MKEKYSVVIRWYNFEHWLFLHHCKPIAKLVYHIMQILFGCSIPPTVELEVGVDIPHFHGIVIHQDTTIMSGTLIYQNVTIGGRNTEAGAVIGHNCILGAGACILGKIHIGDNVNVGANAVVINDVPSDCTVVGIPARVVKAKDKN